LDIHKTGACRDTINTLSVPYRAPPLNYIFARPGQAVLLGHNKRAGSGANPLRTNNQQLRQKEIRNAVAPIPTKKTRLILKVCPNFYTIFHHLPKITIFE
jgi:hypothetical protein